MNAHVSSVDTVPTVVPMTVTALRILDENGFFDGDTNRHELVDGVLVMTPPPGSGHYFVEGCANRAFNRALMEFGLFDSYYVQTGASFEIDEATLVGPDLLILPVSTEPTKISPQTIVTLVEIAWSSRANDLGLKAKIYAGTGVADYWVLDIATKSVIVHRNPRGGSYGSVQTFTMPDRVSCLALPALSVAVDDLF